MSSFKEFWDEFRDSFGKEVGKPEGSLENSQSSLVSTINGLLTTSSIPLSEKKEFSEEVVNSVQDDSFVSEFSDRIGEPSELETEDEFVDRGARVLKEMLYRKFGLTK